jgi:hypothetical protein
MQTIGLASFVSGAGLHLVPASPFHPDWQDNVEKTLWPRLLRPFTTVKNLYLSEEFALRIVPALEELVGGRMTEVLPTLQNIFLERIQTSGPVREGIDWYLPPSVPLTFHVVYLPPTIFLSLVSCRHCDLVSITVSDCNVESNVADLKLGDLRVNDWTTSERYEVRWSVSSYSPSGCRSRATHGPVTADTPAC